MLHKVHEAQAALTHFEDRNKRATHVDEGDDADEDDDIDEDDNTVWTSENWTSDDESTDSEGTGESFADVPENGVLFGSIVRGVKELWGAMCACGTFFWRTSSIVANATMYVVSWDIRALLTIVFAIAMILWFVGVVTWTYFAIVLPDFVGNTDIDESHPVHLLLDLGKKSAFGTTDALGALVGRVVMYIDHGASFPLAWYSVPQILLRCPLLYMAEKLIMVLLNGIDGTKSFSLFTKLKVYVLMVALAMQCEAPLLFMFGMEYTGPDWGMHIWMSLMYTARWVFIDVTNMIADSSMGHAIGLRALL